MKPLHAAWAFLLAVVAGVLEIPQLVLAMSIELSLHCGVRRINRTMARAYWAVALARRKLLGRPRLLPHDHLMPYHPDVPEVFTGGGAFVELNGGDAEVMQENSDAVAPSNGVGEILSKPIKKGKA